MSLDYIRRFYGVPAKRGGRIRFQGRGATIIGANSQYLRVRLDDGTRALLHPTWEVEYPPPAPAYTPSGLDEFSAETSWNAHSEGD